MKNYVLFFYLLATTLGFSQSTDSFFNEVNLFLKAHVDNGNVNYNAIHANPAQLNAIIEKSESLKISKDNPEVYQAFWINMYNLLVIKGVINNYPITSPMDVKGFFDSITYTIAGEQVTLNTIENNLLRAPFKDPRFHFVLVCGAVGCPPLINQVYMPETLNAQMDTQTKNALNGKFIKVNANKKSLAVSQIMEWYKADFTQQGMSEIDFINLYRDQKIPNNYKLSYTPYNWSLNKQ